MLVFRHRSDCSPLAMGRDLSIAECSLEVVAGVVLGAADCAALSVVAGVIAG